MTTTTFETAKVGDRVWSVSYGWGRIYGRASQEFFVDFHGFGSVSYSFGGYHGDESRTLFWDEIQMIPPEKPRQTVKKSKKVWILVRSGEGPHLGTYNYRPDAQAYACDGDVVRPATLEWEEEE